MFKRIIGNSVYGKRPRFYRPSKGHIFGWEIYRWNLWFITFSPGNFEMQLNMYGKLK